MSNASPQLFRDHHYFSINSINLKFYETLPTSMELPHSSNSFYTSIDLEIHFSLALCIHLITMLLITFHTTHAIINSLEKLLRYLSN